MSKVSWVGRAGLALVGVLTVGCGGEAKGRGGDQASLPNQANLPSEDTTSIVSSLGWSVRDSTPYARTEHSSVIDTRRDRLLLVGGRANDIWQLPLSGEHEQQWAQLVPEGARPPGGHAEVAYDEREDRVLALFTRYEGGTALGELWILSLGETPTWQRAVTQGPDPGAELGIGRIVVHDSTLLALGGGGTWSLDLWSMTWLRLADAPDDGFSGPLFTGWGGEAFVLDPPRLRLLAVAQGGDVWEMPLATRVWSSLGRAPSVSAAAPGLYDVARQLLIFPDQLRQVFSLATNQWQAQSDESFRVSSVFSSVTVDAKRERALYVTGPGFAYKAFADDAGGGDIWQLSLDSFASELLVPSARGAIHRAQGVWDPTREAVLSLHPDGYARGPTITRSLAAGAVWEDLGIGAAPLGFGATLLYDRDAGGVLGFGGLDGSQIPTNAVAWLSSVPGSQWEKLATTGSPEPRWSGLVVYDSERRRLIVRGGRTEPDGRALDDVWSLSTATMTWSQLEQGGDAPGPRNDEAGVYDPVGNRLIVWGGARGDYDEQRFEDVHALSLDGAPTWTAINPVGELPVTLGPRSAVYDPAGKRIIALLEGPHELLAYALELGDTPRWRQFCALGVSPDPLTQRSQPVLTDDGVFMAVNNGAFKLDLETPYCD